MIPPGGTVTFLFTDIEGSTRLWEERAEEMQVALALHDSVVRTAILRSSGVVFKTVGDAFYAAFSRAQDALDAAVSAQLALIGQEWGEIGRLKVRMAVHTGDAEQRDGDYFGPALNRVSRLLAIGHGDQILCSLAAFELVRDRLPENVTLGSLGLHRLKDLNRPEQVFLAAHPGLPTEFPPLKSLDSRPNNLPIQLSSFVGREQEMSRLSDLLTSHRLVTLLGPGGTGKTRLSLQIGANLLDRFVGGIWFVELAALTDPALVPQTVAAVLEVREVSGTPLMQTLIGYLKGRSLLLILDNCEHLLDACSTFAEKILQTCPEITVLASSREALKISGEATFRVPALQLPDPESPATMVSVSEFEAVRLFIDRATGYLATFTVTNANAPALAQLCARLDGIPLAIELAAARIGTLSVEEINARLDDRFQLLTGGSRSALPRQQTLRALIDWSYDMLSVSEKALLVRLSVFTGGWTPEAAEAVCAGAALPPWQIPDMLASLTDRSLVTAETNEGGTRSRLLETIRQYAADRLHESGEEVRLRKRHREYFFRFAEDLEQHLSGRTQQAILARFRQEHDNLRAALEGALADEPSMAASLAAAMGEFWYLSGHLREGRDSLERVLAQKSADPTVPGQAEALFQAGRIAGQQGDYERARSFLLEALDVFRSCGEKRATARALNSLGSVCWQQDRYEEARSYLNESLAIYREINYTAGSASVLTSLATVARYQSELETSIKYNEESLALHKALGDRRGVAVVLINLGNTLSDAGEVGRALSAAEESLAIGRELEDNWFISYSLTALANIAILQNELARARAMAEEALNLVRNIGDRALIASLTCTLADISSHEGDYTSAHSLLHDSLEMRRDLGQTASCAYLFAKLAELALVEAGSGVPMETVQARALRAAHLLGAAASLREETNAPLLAAEQQSLDATTAGAREKCGDAPFDPAWAEGRAMSIEQAIAYALAS